MNINRIVWTLAAVIAAALSVSATCCFAETLNANVPFKFQVQEQHFPPGDYTITSLQNSGTPILLLRNWEARKSILLVPVSRSAKSTNETPRMVFQCGGEGCALSEIWGTAGAGGLTVPLPRNSGRSERNSLVYLTRQKSGH